ncbi:hypothetical protein [Methanimicrococcus hacksteinii]|nr:hypothetical protein [Methanimicrococcus sp. At1]
MVVFTHLFLRLFLFFIFTSISDIIILVFRPHLLLISQNISATISMLFFKKREKEKKKKKKNLCLFQKAVVGTFFKAGIFRIRVWFVFVVFYGCVSEIKILSDVFVLRLLLSV